MKIIKFYKNGCRPCEEVAKYFQSKGIKTENVNAFDNPDMAMEYGVMGIPTVILLDNEGNEVQRTSGYNPKELDEIIEKLGE